MKFTAFATLFAALVVSGQAAATPEASAMDGTPVANVVDVPAPEAAVETRDNRALRGATKVAADSGAKATQTRKMKEASSGGSGFGCTLCCNDDDDLTC
jgi:hypothetical protein